MALTGLHGYLAALGFDLNLLERYPTVDEAKAAYFGFS